jgi:hypothetical protein
VVIVSAIVQRPFILLKNVSTAEAIQDQAVLNHQKAVQHAKAVTRDHHVRVVTNDHLEAAAVVTAPAEIATLAQNWVQSLDLATRAAQPLVQLAVIAALQHQDELVLSNKLSLR